MQLYMHIISGHTHILKTHLNFQVNLIALLIETIKITYKYVHNNLIHVCLNV